MSDERRPFQDWLTADAGAFHRDVRALVYRDMRRHADDVVRQACQQAVERAPVVASRDEAVAYAAGLARRYLWVIAPR